MEFKEGLGYAAIAAFLGVIAAAWNQIKSFAQQIYGRIIITLEVKNPVDWAVLAYLRSSKFSRSRYGVRHFGGDILHVRPKEREEMVAWEDAGSKVSLFWSKWKPIWVSEVAAEDREARNNTNKRVTVSFVRWTWEPDDFIIQATRYYNQLTHGEDGYDDERYNVISCVGEDAERVGRTCYDYDSEMPSYHGGGAKRPLWSCRILEWRRSDLGPPTKRGNAIRDLALTETLVDAVEEAFQWKQSKHWFNERGIPWRRGWLLVGPPGTGKSSLVRALAEDLDLPVFSYDLASLTNREFQSHWNQMLERTPCIALIEDIDATFDGRKNITKGDRGGGLTYDCFLNALDGVRRTDGIFLVVTTNDIKKIDSALGLPNQDGRSTRPGRVDRVLVFGPLDEPGRQKIACRVLRDYPEAIYKIVAAGAGDTGAQFQERCTQAALTKFWTKEQQEKMLAEAGKI